MLNIQYKLDKEQMQWANLIQESKMFLYLCNYFIIFTGQDRLIEDYNI